MYLLSNDQFPKFSHHDACIPSPSGLSSKSGVTSQDPSPPRATVLKCQTLPPASPSDRGPKLLVFFILTPSPLGPRTWVSRLLSSYATHPLPPGPRRQKLQPLSKGTGVTGSLPRTQESCHAASFAVTQYSGPPSPPVRLVRSLCPVCSPLLATSQATSKSTVFSRSNSSSQSSSPGREDMDKVRFRGMADAVRGLRGATGGRRGGVEGMHWAGRWAR